MTGSIAQRYPVEAYGIDNQIGFSITHLERSFLGALQSVAGLVWMALVFCVRGVLALLEWGFSIDLLGEAMSGVRGTLTTLHERVIGRPWFLAAISVTGLWGIWRGLVQRQATQTITGLAATVALMVCGLVVLARPQETVGYASRLANDASLGILSAATGQDPDRPMRSLASASIGVFEVMVRDPWCALEFGSVDYCHRHPPGHPELTNADVWLRYSAGSDERQALHLLLKGKDPDDRGGLVGRAKDLVGLGGDRPADLPDEVKKLVAKDPDRATMQDAGGTFTRFALLALIAAGISGACVLLAYLGVRLLLAAVLALLLLLFAPAMLLAPCFGESGRATFIAWAKRLIGALAAKLIYALFLAVVLAAAATLRQLEIGWFGVWLLQIAFWWGVFLKRHELIGFVSVKPQASRESGGGLARQLAHGYYAMQFGRVAAQRAGKLLAAPRRAGSAVALRRDQATRAREAATGELAAERFDSEARSALEADYHRARTALDQRQAVQRELRAIDRRLTGFDETHASSRASGAPAPTPNEEQAALLRRRRELLDQLATPGAHAAGQRVAHGDRNRAQTGSVVSGRDLDAYRSQRAADHAAELPVTHERHLRAAGIDPDAFAVATPADRAAMTRHVEAHLERERDLLAALPDLTPNGDRPDPGRAELHIDAQAVRSRLAVKHAQARRERRRHRAAHQARGR
ncbi:MAG: hypothetical protein AB7H92_16675 [Microbacteriaceae bacterium]